MFKTIPNILTLIRIILIPVFVVLYYLPLHYAHYLAAFVFALACITDWWDGFLARRWDQTTKLGAFLDPVADKLIITAALVMIVAEPYYQYIVIATIVIISREIIVSALREWMAEIGSRSQVAVATIAKWKTLSQMLAVFCLIGYRPGEHIIIAIVGYVALYIATVLTLWTMFKYLYASRKAFD